MRAVAREDGDAVPRQALDQLILGVPHALDGAEGIQVLWTDRRDQADRWMDQVDQLANVADMAGAHLRDEHLMRGHQLLTDDARHAHGRVEARGRRQHAVFDGEDVAQQELRACLAVAAGDADFDQVRHRFKPPLRIVQKLVVDIRLHRLRADGRQRDQQRLKRRQQIAQHRRNREHDPLKQQRRDRMHRNQPFDALREHEGLLRLFSPRAPERQRRQQRDQRQTDQGGNAKAHARDAQRRQRHGRQRRAHRVAAHAPLVARQLIALQLEVVQKTPAACDAAGRQHQRLQRKQDACHSLPSSRKLRTMRRNLALCSR